MPRNISKTVYSFGEIKQMVADGRARKVALLRASTTMCQICTPDDWEHFMEARWDERLEALGFIDPKVSYNLSYSQGDGASFVSGCDTYTLVDVLGGAPRTIGPAARLDAVILAEKFGELQRSVDFAKIKVVAPKIGLYYDVVRSGHHYVHEGTCRVEANVATAPTGEEAAVVSRFGAAVEDLRRKVSQAIFADYMAEYESLTTDEHMTEVSSNAGVWFDINGRHEK